MADVIIQDGNINWKIRDLRKMNFPTQASNIEGACWIEYDEEGNPVLKMYHNGKVVDVSSGDESLMTEQDKANLDSIFHQTSTTYKVGDQVHVAEFPSYYVLECTTAGTTSSNRPNFSSIDIEASPSSTSGDEDTNNKINSISINGNVIEPDSSKNVNINLSNYTTSIKDNIGNASSTTDGLMSAADKSKLDNLSTSSSSGTSSGEANKIENVAVNGTDLEINDKRVNIDLSEYAKKTDVTNSINNIGNASTSSNGLMSSSDKNKLDDIATGAEVNKIDNVAVNGTDLNITDKKVNIPIFNSSTDGVVSKSDGKVNKFLRADGAWYALFDNTPTLTFNTEEITLDEDNLTEVITFRTNSDGQITVSNKDDSVCVISYDNTNKITVTYVGEGISKITVSITGTNDFTAISKSVVVRNNPTYSPIFQENTPVQIRNAALDGVASTLWSVGDVINVKLNGILGPNTLEDVELGLQIIGFNHNAEIEGNNTIHFQCGCIDGKPIALYWTNTPSSQHHTTYTNSGGWEQSDLRTRCNEFYNCLPQEWQDVIKTTNKYTDNTGNISDSEEAVTVTQDKVFILAEYEVFGAIHRANQYEKNKQQQYEYYISGTPYSDWNIRQRTLFRIPSLSVDSDANIWWLRSPSNYTSNYFCSVYDDGRSDEFNGVFNNNNHRAATAVTVLSSVGDFGILESSTESGPGTEYYSSIKKITPLEGQENVTLTGTKNANTFYIYGGASNVLTGGLKADTFIFKGGGGVVTDYGIGVTNNKDGKLYATSTTQKSTASYYAYDRTDPTSYLEGLDVLQVKGTVKSIAFKNSSSTDTTSKNNQTFSAYVNYTDSNGADQVVKLDNIVKNISNGKYINNYSAAEKFWILQSDGSDSYTRITGDDLTGLFTEYVADDTTNALDALTQPGTNNVITRDANYSGADIHGFAPAFAVG